MILIGEDLPEIHQVTQRHLEAVFDESETDFGKFVVLMENDSKFIQAACVWEPTEECSQFLQKNASDPYRLEYKEESTGEIFAADRWLPLSEIREAFIEYLRGTENWKQNKVWHKIDY